MSNQSIPFDLKRQDSPHIARIKEQILIPDEVFIKDRLSNDVAFRVFSCGFVELLGA